MLTFSTGNSLDFSRELALSKAAVLYGDTVTLIGPKVTLLSYVDRLRSGSREERDALLLRMLRAYPGGEKVLRDLDALSASGARHRRAVETLKARMLAQVRDDIEGAIKRLLEETRYAEFSKALRAERLTLDPLTRDGRPATRQVVGDALAGMIAAAAGIASKAPDPMLEAFLERIIGTMLGASSSLPLLDSEVRSLAEALRDVLTAMGVLAPRMSAEPTVAAGLLEALPTFPDAAMDEIIDARRALEPALVRFRAAIAKVEAETTLDVMAGPIDAEIAALWRREVAPAFQELRELQAELRLGQQLVRHTAAAGKDITRPLLALLLTSNIQMEALVRVLVALVPVAFDIAARVSAERQRLEQQRRANPFVFLYEIEQRFS